MPLNPYERLAPYYHKKWTAFARGYVQIIRRLGFSSGELPTSVLDVACGTGVLAGELSQAGFTVVGMDLSEEMISIAKANYPNINFLVADMRAMRLGMKFDLITCTFDSLNYITSKNALSDVFVKVGEHLYNDGHFLFDINTPKLYEDKQKGTLHHTIDCEEFDQILKYDGMKLLSRTIFQFSDGTFEEHLQRPYTFSEMQELICKSNFKLERAFVDEKLHPPEPNSYKIFYLLKKVETGNA